MSRDSFVHLPDHIRQVEAPSSALQEKREAWLKAEANLDKPMRDFLLRVQEPAKPHSGLSDRRRVANGFIRLSDARVARSCGQYPPLYLFRAMRCPRPPPTNPLR